MLTLVLGRQGKNWVRFNVLARYKLESIFLDDHGDNQLGFHQRKLVGDTLTGTAPKWKILVPRTFGDPLGRKRSGSKPSGLSQNAG